MIYTQHAVYITNPVKNAHVRTQVMCIIYVFLKAIEFAMEEGDDDLWDALIHLSISNPSKFFNYYAE